MRIFSNLTFRTRITLACLLFALLPLGVLTVVTWRAAASLSESQGQQYRTVASNIADKIDRNLFERYGDVQAFGVNQAVQDRESWGKPGDDNLIIQAMNQYVDLYDVYYLTLLVDTQGKLIAVNTKDNAGHNIDTADLYSRDYSHESWFQDALAGKFYESKDKSCTGTVVEHMYVDDAVKKIYGDEGLVLGFSASVRDEKGQVIAVWKNVAKFGVVEEIVYSYYRDLKAQDLGSAEITLLDDKGNVIIDCDPSTRGTDKVVRDMAVIGKFNLAEKGVDAAQRVLRGETGSITRSRHARKLIDQTAGFAPLKGALGFPGMHWNVLVRVACTQALAAANHLKHLCLLTFASAVVLVLVGTYFFARSIGKIITQSSRRPTLRRSVTTVSG